MVGTRKANVARSSCIFCRKRLASHCAMKTILAAAFRNGMVQLYQPMKAVVDTLMMQA